MFHDNLFPPAGWRIAPLYRCSGNTCRGPRWGGWEARYGWPRPRRLRMGWNGREEKRRARVGQRSANAPIRMFFVFFVSWLVCSTATRAGEKVAPASREHRGVVAQGLTVGVALIYRGNRSLFLSRRPSRPPNFDRYRLVIAFRYLNISAARNLLDELEARVASRDSSALMLNRYCTFYRLVAVRRLLFRLWSGAREWFLGKWEIAGTLRRIRSRYAAVIVLLLLVYITEQLRSLVTMKIIVSRNLEFDNWIE